MIPAPVPLAEQGTQILDSLFSHLADAASGRPPPDERNGFSAGPPGADEPDELAHVQPPPQIANDADLRAAHEWLHRERQRLDAYTRGQLARVRREHQGFLQQTYLQEQALVLRTQELNRKDEMLAHQAGAIRREAGDLAERQRKLAPYLDPLWHGQEELAEMRRVSCGLRGDVKGQRALLERLRAEAAALEQEREAARAELAAGEAALREEKIALAARQEQLNQRLLGLDGAEAAVRRRTAELDELEARLRRDFAHQEEQLSQLRRLSASLLQDTKGQWALLERLRAEAASREEARDTDQKQLAARAAALQQKQEALDARQGQMDYRLLALEEAEVAARRRAAELDELQMSLRRDFAEQERELNSRRQDARAADPCCAQV